MIFKRPQERNRHDEKCTDEVQVSTKQIRLGDSELELDKLIRLGYLPKTFKNYRQDMLACFDIETLEEKVEEQVSDWTCKEANHRIVSLAIASNVPGYSTQFFMRRSSNPADEQNLINQFVDEIYDLHERYIAELPTAITNAIAELERDIENAKFGWFKTLLMKLHGFAKKYTQLCIYAFNGGELFYTFLNLFIYSVKHSYFFRKIRLLGDFSSACQCFGRKNWRAP